MSDLEKIIETTVNDQHPVSEQFQVTETTAADASASSLNGTGEVSAPPASAAAPQKRGRGRPKGKGKAKERQEARSFVPDEVLHQATQQNAQEPPQMPDAVALQRRNAAAGATVLVQTSGMLIAGEDGKMNRDEFSNVHENFDKFFEAKGISDFPPSIALGIALGGYYIRVMLAEKSRPKIALFSAWIKTKFSFFSRKTTPQQSA